MGQFDEARGRDRRAVAGWLFACCAVLALLVVLIILLSLLLHPVIAIPAGFLAGGWLFRKGLHGLRDGVAQHALRQPGRAFVTQRGGQAGLGQAGARCLGHDDDAHGRCAHDERPT